MVDRGQKVRLEGIGRFRRERATRLERAARRERVARGEKAARQERAPRRERLLDGRRRYAEEGG